MLIKAMSYSCSISFIYAWFPASGRGFFSYLTVTIFPGVKNEKCQMPLGLPPPTLGLNIDRRIRARVKMISVKILIHFGFTH
jgi:hypothetical protein